MRRRLPVSIPLVALTKSISGRRYGSIAWYPEMLARSFGMAKAEAGAALGLIYMIAGTAGTFAGAGCAAWLERRGHADANMRWVMHAALLAAVPAVTAPLLPSSTLTLAVFSTVIFLHYSHFGVAMAALQLATPGRMRGQVTAIALFATNLLGPANLTWCVARQMIDVPPAAGTVASVPLDHCGSVPVHVCVGVAGVGVAVTVGVSVIAGVLVYVDVPVAVRVHSTRSRMTP